MIREWTKRDIERISEIEEKSFADPWTREMLEDCLRYHYYHCFLVEEGGQVCGYCCLIQLFEVGEVANIAVDKDFRGRGFAKALMEKMHALSKEKGGERCLLEVRKSNTPAIRLYEGYGYKAYGVREGYYSDGEDAILMEKIL